MTQPLTLPVQAGTSGGHPMIGGSSQMPFQSAMSLACAEEVFTGPVVLHIPPSADRHEYKKKSGSSDSYNTYDAIET
jgi:hypothetical protein